MEKLEYNVSPDSLEQVKSIRNTFLTLALLVSAGTIAYFNELYFGYASMGLNPISIWVDIYFFMIFYSVLFLLTGFTFGRGLLKYVIHIYQALAVINIALIIYLVIIEHEAYFQLGALVFFGVFTAPMGLLATALLIAIYASEMTGNFIPVEQHVFADNMQYCPKVTNDRTYVMI